MRRIAHPIHETRTPMATSARIEIDVSSCVAAQPSAAAQYGMPAAKTRTPIEAQARILKTRRIAAERRQRPYGARLKAE